MSTLADVADLETAGYDLKAVKVGHARTLEDVLAEQRSGEAATSSSKCMLGPGRATPQKRYKTSIPTERGF
jgi:hypothetical protein